MNELHTLRTLQAWSRGCPLPTLEALPWRRSDPSDTLVLAFVRMAGEELPWGFAVGHPGEEPRVHIIPEPRNRDRAAALCTALAAVLLPHVSHPEHAAAASFDPAARQLWLPGPKHLDMLHLLALRYAHVRKGDAATVATLRALARACGFLFREASRPGQTRVLDATACLRHTFAFPAEPLRCTHLGYLLAWLCTPGGREERMAAASEAEKSTAGDLLDPTYEDTTLIKPVEAWGKAKGPDLARLAREIESALRPELERRWQWTCDAWTLLQRDPRPENDGLGELDKLTRREFQSQYMSFEQKVLDAPEGSSPFVPHPETDHHAPAAISRYFASLHASELRDGSMPHGDPALVAAALATGDAIAGTLTQVHATKSGRAQIIQWTVRTPAEDLCRLRVGSTVCPAGQQGRTAVVRSIEVQGAERVFTLEVTGWKNAREGLPGAGDPSLRGQRIALLPHVDAFFSSQRASSVWAATGPGAWLTHGEGSPQPTRPLQNGAALLQLVRSLGTSGS